MTKTTVNTATWTRRRLMRTTGTVAVAAICADLRLLNEAVQAEEPLMIDKIRSGWIDAHSHIWTREIDRYPLADGQSIDVLDPPSFTAEELLATCEPLGVTRVVLIQHKPHHGLDNSYILDALRNHPGRFAAVACIDADVADPTLVMAELQTHGATGFRIRPGEGGSGLWQESSGMRAMWAYAAEKGLAICPLINPEHLPQVQAMCRLVPETDVVIDHFARIGIDGRIDASDLDMLCSLAQFPRVHVKVSAFYALGRKHPPYDDLVPMIRRVYESFGPQRLMWGSDSPYQLVEPNNYAASLELVRDGLDFLSDEDRGWLLRGTAQQVYFRD